MRWQIPSFGPYNSFYKCLILILGYENETGHYYTASSLSFEFPRKSVWKNAKQESLIASVTVSRSHVTRTVTLKR